MSVKVLVVDDLSFIRSAIKEIIERDDFQVIAEAANGREALMAFINSKPDIVLMDITMPVMDGLEALEEIKKLNNKAKVLMCSALSQQEYVIKAIQLGARDFIVKPFKPERILSALKKAAEIYI